MSDRPERTEYSDGHVDYINRVPEEDIVAAMEASTRYTTELLESFTGEQASRLMGTSKWTLKQVLGHLCDGERVLAYRTMRIARGDKTPLPGYEQDDFVVAGDFAARDWDDLLDEWATLRKATLIFARSLTPEMLRRTGTSNDSPVSARALLYIIVGHERHHVELIRQHALNHPT